MTTIIDLIDRWNTDEGRPYKGRLIDIESYAAEPDNIGCMCAQGQVLHLVAGWTPDRLNTSSQSVADAETAKLLNISRAHAVLLRTVNDRADGAPGIVLTNPGKVIGDKWPALLDFWWHVSGMTKEQWTAERDAARPAERDAALAAAWTAARAAAGDAAGDAAWDAALAAAWTAARYAARYAAGDAAWDAARYAAGASNEIQGADILRKNGTPLFFLPEFGFAKIEDIPPRPADYGITA